MSALRVIGIDPGPTLGLVLLKYTEPALCEPEVLQCTHGLLPDLLEHLLLDVETAVDEPTIVQVEKFVVGRRSGRSSSAGAGAVTRDLIGALHRVWDFSHARIPGGGRIVFRSAAAVKPWAVDERLDAAGLLTLTKGMTHARDAARHALFAACRDGGVPDPLSNQTRKATP